MVLNALRAPLFLAPLLSAMHDTLPAPSLSATSLLPEPLIAVVSLYTSFAEASHWLPQSALGAHYFAAPFLPSANYTAATNLYKQYRDRFPNSTSPFTHDMEAMYSAVLAYARAVTKAGSFNVDLVRAAMRTLTVSAPSGSIELGGSQHTSKHFMLEQVGI